MADKFRLGKYEFDTVEEYENGLRDLKKIETIVERLDVDDTRQALKIYQLIRDGKVRFQSEIGVAFFCDISDRLADHSEEMLREINQGAGGEKKKRRESAKKLEEQSKIFRWIGIGLVGVAFLCFGIFLFLEWKDVHEARKLEELKRQRQVSEAVDWYLSHDIEDDRADMVENVEEEEDSPQSMEETTEQTALDSQTTTQIPTRDVLPEYEKLLGKYPHIIGWLMIEDTPIDLPVMQTEDNDFYLHRNIEGQEDKNGTLFLDYRDDVLQGSSNYIIYGHNMKSGAMFGTLKQYLEQDYIADHSLILFDTIYEKQEYRVIAVCLSEVGYQDDDTYRYYDYINPSSKEEFDMYLREVRACAIYDDTKDLTMEDTLLTLSTCNSYTEDGRLFVVAKRIN